MKEVVNFKKIKTNKAILEENVSRMTKASVTVPAITTLWLVARTFFHFKTNKLEKGWDYFVKELSGLLKVEFVFVCGNYRIIANEKEDSQFYEQRGLNLLILQLQQLRV